MFYHQPMFCQPLIGSLSLFDRIAGVEARGNFLECGVASLDFELLANV